MSWPGFISDGDTPRTSASRIELLSAAGSEIVVSPNIRKDSRYIFSFRSVPVWRDKGFWGSIAEGDRENGA